MPPAACGLRMMRGMKPAIGVRLIAGFFVSFAIVEMGQLLRAFFQKVRRPCPGIAS